MILQKRHYIYKLLDQDGVEFYYGISIDTDIRLAQHKAQFGKAMKEEKCGSMYKSMVNNNITSFTMEVISEERNEFRAKLQETLLICSAKLDDSMINLNIEIFSDGRIYAKNKSNKKKFIKL